MIKRFLEADLKRLFTQYPVVTLTGPRQSGKTTLCQIAFPKTAYVNLEDLESRRFAQEDPKGFLARYTDGVILDEIQRTPDLPSFIQGIVDEKKRSGLFILTGSQQFEVFRTVRQSLAGRTAVLRLLPLAFGEIYPGAPFPPLEQILYHGFYPRIHDQRLNPTEAISFYVSTYLERDLQGFTHIRDLGAFERFLKICASQAGQIINYSQMGADCGVDQKTARAWLSILEASYIIFLLQPHFKNFRKRLVKSPKLYFCDVGLAAYLLDIQEASQMERHPLRGPLFENFVVSEFLKNCYNHVRERNLSFFRDHVGNEVDLLLDHGAEIVTVEIKSGKTIGGDFFKNLGFYANLSGSQNRKRFVVYGGHEIQQGSRVTVYPYTHLPQLFAELDR